MSFSADFNNSTYSSFVKYLILLYLSSSSWIDDSIEVVWLDGVEDSFEVVVDILLILSLELSFELLFFLVDAAIIGIEVAIIIPARIPAIFLLILKRFSSVVKASSFIPLIFITGYLRTNLVSVFLISLFSFSNSSFNNLS